MEANSIEDGRSRLVHSVARETSPIAAVILFDLIAQLPNGFHINGWFFPGHKAIYTARNITYQAYFYMLNKLLKSGYLHKKKDKKGLWWKIDFDRLEETRTKADYISRDQYGEDKQTEVI